VFYNGRNDSLSGLAFVLDGAPLKLIGDRALPRNFGVRQQLEPAIVYHIHPHTVFRYFQVRYFQAQHRANGGLR
jgi:hypothetical protein